jgi:hypothetical protein
MEINIKALSEEVQGLALRKNILEGQVTDSEWTEDKIGTSEYLAKTNDEKFDLTSTDLVWTSRLDNLKRVINTRRKLREKLPLMREELDNIRLRYGTASSLTQAINDLEYAETGKAEIEQAVSEGLCSASELTWIIEVIAEQTALISKLISELSRLYGDDVTRFILPSSGDSLVIEREANSEFARTISSMEGSGDILSYRMSQMIKSDYFPTLLRNIEAIQQTHPNEDLSVNPEFFSSFMGEVFEYLSFEQIAASPVDGAQFSFTLSPQQTFELFRILHPDRKIIETPFSLQKGIDGITIPDGIVFKETQFGLEIVVICEYTLQDLNKSTSKQEQLDVIKDGPLNKDIKKFTAKDSRGFNKEAFGYLYDLISASRPSLKRNIIYPKSVGILCVVPPDRAGKKAPLGVQIVNSGFSSAAFYAVCEVFLEDLRNYYQKHGNLRLSLA